MAVAAYNAGETNVDRWIRDAGGRESFDVDDDIPFPETCHYVRGVNQRREQYRENYADDFQASSRLRKPSAPRTTAPAWLTRSASQRSDVTT